jgi:GT2 family glycosyltransferase
MNDTKRNIIAVIMSVYIKDSLDYLRKCLDSLYEQRYKSFDIYIQQDGPLEPLVDEYLVKELQEGRIKYLGKRSDNKGLAYSLNDLLRVVLREKYTYIVRMDADDICSANRIGTLYDFMDKNNDIDVAGSYIVEFTDDSAIESGKVISYPLDHDQMKALFLRRGPLAHATAIFKYTFFEKVGFYSLNSIRNEDTLLWLNGFKAGCRFGNVPEVLYYVRYDIKCAARRVGFKKSFSDFVDRLRVIIDLGGRPMDYFIAVARLFIQNMPRPVYLSLRSLLIHNRD